MDWETIFEQEQSKPYYSILLEQVKHDRTLHNVYPDDSNVFKAFDDLSFDDVKVVIVGQDPYHQPGQAMGLSFSVHKDIKLPKSLVNIFKELEADLGIKNVHGDLSSWTHQGVLLLNTILTVRESEPLSHAKYGWETFTDAILKALGNREKPVIFVLWGKNAQKKRELLKEHHYFIESSHPSPLGAYRGFIGSRPFSKINEYLKSMGETPIDWRNYV